jgi:hypothetical protein
MAPSFVACDREQPFLLPPDVRDWLPEDHFAWFVIDAVDAIDMARSMRPGLRAPGADVRRHPPRTQGGRVTEVPEALLADAGYWHQEQMERIMATGTQVLVPPDSSRARAPAAAGTEASTHPCAGS